MNSFALSLDSPISCNAYNGIHNPYHPYVDRTSVWSRQDLDVRSCMTAPHPWGAWPAFDTSQSFTVDPRSRELATTPLIWARPSFDGPPYSSPSSASSKQDSHHGYYSPGVDSSVYIQAPSNTACCSNSNTNNSNNANSNNNSSNNSHHRRPYQRKILPYTQKTPGQRLQRRSIGSEDYVEDEGDGDDSGLPTKVKRQKCRAANRSAARKCRQKKKEQAQELETEFVRQQARNQELLLNVDFLRKETFSLQNALFCHTQCRDEAINSYLAAMVDKVRRKSTATCSSLASPVE
ncbi:hypothetical protein ASPZODRAFT_140178 [Penicilliopsis zonata CBS 506.65]|uniref:BZIP domain-containing protein n=1 Tax=Penicilliopsis zonata CBS 506.65 TaxID=1073090 RepID=A0A1L9SQ89_9EURO|nr:hypothetical protein ASPZODRAFT_140178 [Penicilliopsis zonata CBS 506.65]OJJ49261.1 hypothetical protein ASPZODRAFT_140178 [Penicilliopsis zonata CBS 506.65]